jgi:peptide chain release factor subunit 3
MDEIKWDFVRYSEIKNQLKPFLTECGYDVNKEVTFVPISGLIGENMIETVKNENADWYKAETPGGPLFDMLDRLPAPKRKNDAGVRIPVLDKMKDMGIFAFGKMEQGIIKTDMNLTLMPQQKDFTVT